MGRPRVNVVVTTSCELDVVMRMRRSCVNGVMCERGCGCVNCLVMFEWSHV